MSYDNILEKIDGDAFHRIMWIVFFFNGFPNVLQVAALAFLHYMPDDHKCAFPGSVTAFLEENPSSLNRTLDYFIPIDPEKKAFSSCLIYNRSELEIFSFLNGTMGTNETLLIGANKDATGCTNGQDYSNSYEIYSASMEFHWVCDNAWVKPIATSVYMGGLGLGAFSGYLSDKFGRRPIIIIFKLALFVMVLLLSFANSAPLYIFLLFVNGFTALINYMAAFVLGVECTVPKKRNFLSIGAFFIYSVGYGISGIMFYIAPNWRWGLRICAGIGVFYIANIWLIPESPRWLMANGRTKEAMDVFRMIAKINNKSEVVEGLQAEVERESKNLMKEKNGTQSGKKQTTRHVIFQILKSPAGLAVLFIVLYSWFCAALVYYGITLNVQSFSGNIYVNSALVGLVEIPGLAIAYLTVKYISRPLGHSVMMMLCGAFCIAAGLFNSYSESASSVCGLLGKAINAGAFYLVYIHTAEIFPTMVRGSFMGLGSCVARIGSFLSPYFIYMGDLYGEIVPYLTMGLITLCSGVLTLLFTPETRLAELPETPEDMFRLETLFNRCLGRMKKKSKKNDRSLVFSEDERSRILT